jgi:hypothetical protein
MRRLPLPLTWSNAWVLVDFDLDREEAARRWGPPHLVNEKFMDLEEADLWAFGFDCGLEVLISFGQRSRHWRLHGNLPEPEHALPHLELPKECASGHPAQRRAWRTQSESPPESWTVWRQDDYGNQFVVDVLASERTARCLADLYEARAHKQSYWVERAGSLGT